MIYGMFGVIGEVYEIDDVVVEVIENYKFKFV